MSTHTDTNVNNLIINKMTKSIYDSLNSISDTELYFITDDDLYLKSNNIKTINGQSLLGSGDITISGGSGSSIDDTAISTSSTYSSSKIDTTYAKKTEIPSLDGYTTESRVNELIAAYMTANYESGDTKEY